MRRMKSHSQAVRALRLTSIVGAVVVVRRFTLHAASWLAFVRVRRLSLTPSGYRRKGAQRPRRFISEEPTFFLRIESCGVRVVNALDDREIVRLTLSMSVASMYEARILNAYRTTPVAYLTGNVRIDVFVLLL